MSDSGAVHQCWVRSLLILIQDNSVQLSLRNSQMRLNSELEDAQLDPPVHIYWFRCE